MTDYEQLFDLAVADADSAANEAKILGDVCSNCKCNQVFLVYEPVYPGTWEEPGSDAVLFCPSCQSEYLIDWSRMSDEEFNL